MHHSCLIWILGEPNICKVSRNVAVTPTWDITQAKWECNVSQTLLYRSLGMRDMWTIYVQTPRKVSGPFFERLTQHESCVERRVWPRVAVRQAIEKGPRTFLDDCISLFLFWWSKSTLCMQSENPNYFTIGGINFSFFSEVDSDTSKDVKQIEGEWNVIDFSRTHP